MSTFERVRKNILKDMARSRVHTAESWADIMLSNTSQLTDCRQQHMFWNWLVNPEEDESLPPCKIADGPQAKEVLPAQTSVPYRAGDEEKEHDVALTNTYHKTGLGCHIVTEPTTKTSMKLPIRPVCESITEDEIPAPEIASGPTEPCGQTEDSISSRYYSNDSPAAFSC